MKKQDPYFSVPIGTLKLMGKHFEEFSKKVLNYLDEDPFVVEIGINNGIKQIISLLSNSKSISYNNN